MDPHGLGAAGNALQPPYRVTTDSTLSTATRDDTRDAGGAESSQAHALLLAL